jgi:hypothetical protein
MIGFLIFYFVFSAIFAVGVLACDQDRIPLDELYERYRLKKELITEDISKLV